MEVLKAGGLRLDSGTAGIRETMTITVLVEATDGYRAVFALAELDSELTDCIILLADTKDGKPLPASEGSYDGPRLFCFTSALDFNPSHFILSHAARLVFRSGDADDNINQD